MNILLWVFQIVVALFCIMGAGWRIANYAEAAKDIPSVQALSQGMWNVIGVVEIILALGLILPGIFNMKAILTPVAAGLLAIELLLISALHLKYFGFHFKATNPAVWTLTLAAISFFIAYGRSVLRPFEGS